MDPTLKGLLIVAGMVMIGQAITLAGLIGNYSAISSFGNFKRSTFVALMIPFGFLWFLFRDWIPMLTTRIKFVWTSSKYKELRDDRNVYFVDYLRLTDDTSKIKFLFKRLEIEKDIIENPQNCMLYLQDEDPRIKDLALKMSKELTFKKEVIHG